MDNANRQAASEKSLNIAEAGVNYYKWHLAHDPEDFKDGQTGDGPYVHEYMDPQGQVIGAYSLEITPPSDGSTIVTIKSTGWINQYPKVKRIIKAQYGIPSLAEFSFISNASTWYGSGITVNGKVHSNNGIRMDGTNTSIVSSAQEDYMCGSETGCSPPTNKPGVWGAGGDSGLWQYPVPIIDFDTIAVNFDDMRTAAIEKGLHLDESDKSGYHLIFSADGTVRINVVTSTSNIKGYSVPGQGLGALGKGGCRDTNQVIQSETYLGTYNLSNNPIIFAEDNLWVEGTVRGRVTVAAVRFPLQSSNAVIWIPSNITYTAYDGSDTLGLVAQNNIYFAKNIPDYFQVDAILVAQKGTIIRHYYYNGCGGTDNAVRQQLTINGSIISYYKSYWNFGSAPDSGFRVRVINFDNNTLYNPPPYFPTSGQYEFISWSEERN